MSSGAHSRDPLARNDANCDNCAPNLISNSQEKHRPAFSPRISPELCKTSAVGKTRSLLPPKATRGDTHFLVVIGCDS